MIKLNKKQKIWAIVACTIIALLLFVEFCLGFTIKCTLNNLGTSIVGADVKVEDVQLRPFRGKVYIKNLVVGAPEGFKTDIFHLTTLDVDYDFWSLFSDTIVINEIIIEDPIVSYELKGLNSNIGKLMEHFETKQKEAKKTETTEAKKVIIKHFKFSGGKVQIASTTLGGAAIPLPVIELYGIGEKSGGVTALEATGEIIYSIGKGVIVAAKDLALGATDVIGDTAGATVNAVGDAAKAVGGFVGGLFSGSENNEADSTKK